MISAKDLVSKMPLSDSLYLDTMGALEAIVLDQAAKRETQVRTYVESDIDERVIHQLEALGYEVFKITRFGDDTHFTISWKHLVSI